MLCGYSEHFSVRLHGLCFFTHSDGPLSPSSSSCWHTHPLPLLRSISSSISCHSSSAWCVLTGAQTDRWPRQWKEGKVFIINLHPAACTFSLSCPPCLLCKTYIRWNRHWQKCDGEEPIFFSNYYLVLKIRLPAETKANINTGNQSAQ